MKYVSKEKQYEKAMFLFLAIEFASLGLLCLFYFIDRTKNIVTVEFLGGIAIGSCITMLIFGALSHIEAVKRVKGS